MVIIITVAFVFGIGIHPENELAAASAQPVPPLLVSPSDKAFIDSTTLTFVWKARGRHLSYDLEIAAAPAPLRANGAFSIPLLRKSNISSTSYRAYLGS